MDIPILIMNIEVFSHDMEVRFLTSSEGILKYDRLIEINIPLSAAQTLNGGPLIGECYSIRYADGMINDPYPRDFYFIGIVDNQLTFSQAPPCTMKNAAPSTKLLSHSF
jgi:hypothetical protein